MLNYNLNYGDSRVTATVYQIGRDHALVSEPQSARTAVRLRFFGDDPDRARYQISTLAVVAAFLVFSFCSLSLFISTQSSTFMKRGARNW